MVSFALGLLAGAAGISYWRGNVATKREGESAGLRERVADGLIKAEEIIANAFDATSRKTASLLHSWQLELRRTEAVRGSSSHAEGRLVLTPEEQQSQRYRGRIVSSSAGGSTTT